MLWRAALPLMVISYYSGSQSGFIDEPFLMDILIQKNLLGYW